MDRLPVTADFVAGVVRDRYPTLRPPFHARWRHFVFEGKDLWGAIAAGRAWRDSAPAAVASGGAAVRAGGGGDAAARAAFDLAITSVLLDAGAGPEWRYRDSATGLTAVRSEGLALASLRWFERGGSSDDPHDPLRADAAALCRLDARAVDEAFQSREGNLLQGAAGRAALLNRLGSAMLDRPDLFAPGRLAAARWIVRCAVGTPPDRTADSPPRPFSRSSWRASDRSGRTGRCWMAVPLGDCWPHPALRGPRPADGFVPLHKLSQWLAYSLIEPLENAGLTVVDVGGLTGLAEYRNGGPVCRYGRPRAE